MKVRRITEKEGKRRREKEREDKRRRKTGEYIPFPELS